MVVARSTVERKSRGIFGCALIRCRSVVYAYFRVLRTAGTTMSTRRQERSYRGMGRVEHKLRRDCKASWARRRLGCMRLSSNDGKTWWMKSVLKFDVDRLRAEMRLKIFNENYFSKITEIEIFFCLEYFFGDFLHFKIWRAERMDSSHNMQPCKDIRRCIHKVVLLVLVGGELCRRDSSHISPLGRFCKDFRHKLEEWHSICSNMEHKT
jgi:hypothetical protein